MKAAAALLLVALWPFHRHHEIRHDPENISTITVVGAEDATVQDRPGCVVTEAGFLYLGEDAVVGISRESCEAAYQDWRHNPPPKTGLLRA